MSQNLLVEQMDLGISNFPRWDSGVHPTLEVGVWILSCLRHIVEGYYLIHPNNGLEAFKIKIHLHCLILPKVVMDSP